MEFYSSVENVSPLIKEAISSESEPKSPKSENENKIQKKKSLKREKS